MNTHTLPQPDTPPDAWPVPPAVMSVRDAERQQVLERIGALAEMRLLMFTHPETTSTADRADVLRWATRFYYATEKAGRYAMAAAVSRERGVQAALDTMEDYTCFPTSRRPAKQLYLYKLMATKAITAFLQGLEGLRGPIQTGGDR